MGRDRNAIYKRIAEFVNKKQAQSEGIYDRDDNAELKRVELNAQTQMSSNISAITPVSELIYHAASWGHKAVAITDFDGVYAFPEAYKKAKKHNIKPIFGINIKVSMDLFDSSTILHTTLLVKNTAGLKNLYKLVSLSHTDYLTDRFPIIPQSVLLKHREGLLIGASYYNISDENIIDALHFDTMKYDYIEIMPSISFLSDDKLIELNKSLFGLGEELNIPVVAVGYVRYIDPWDELPWQVLREAKGYSFKQESLYFRTTKEMLEMLSYLGNDESYKVVVTNTNIIADMVEELSPIPEGFFLPKIDNAEDEMLSICNNRLKELYGDNIPSDVKMRIEKEIENILKNNFASIYMITQNLVKKSNDEGYTVGSRGCIGASFVAFLLGITDVNPLIHNIQIETLTGLGGDKIPDIDLNFSDEYQQKAHKHLAEVCGEYKVFHAGTQSLINDWTAFNYVRIFEKNYKVSLTKPEREFFINALVGVQKSTGKHPGGMFIVPSYKDISDFTPIQHPTNDRTTNIITSHFCYSYLFDSLYKIDILGHNDPTMIKALEQVTNISAKTIPFDDEKTIKLFQDADTLGVPEFGSKIVRKMIKLTKPKTFQDLIKISALSHGTNVWKGTAEKLIKSGIVELKDVIATRDDIMVYLLEKGFDRKTAFEIMNVISRGKGLLSQFEYEMLEKDVPNWFIDCCKKIKYLFPKAHAVAYTIMAFRIAFFKAHYREEFEKLMVEMKAVNE